MTDIYLFIEDEQDDAIEFKNYGEFIQVQCVEPVNVRVDDAIKMRNYLDEFIKDCNRSVKK